MGQGTPSPALVPSALLCSVAPGSRSPSSKRPEPRPHGARPRARRVPPHHVHAHHPPHQETLRLLLKDLKGDPFSRAWLCSPRAGHHRTPPCRDPHLHRPGSWVLSLPSPRDPNMGPELCGRCHLAPAWRPGACWGGRALDPNSVAGWGGGLILQVT
ncbi:hypothetical protein mRhiFer1_009506 [Rhinolophus ferrumequinum]|uniref:Uncharacterized protein n=1 Tax=Rhinolophus ferrumequinum TaxID=59479 RepID=A0A7J7RAT9_RHIFE|nr:hypothetical protein mRhiFer1_009506 [Rhinolophus ferrumequinum]